MMCEGLYNVEYKLFSSDQNAETGDARGSALAVLRGGKILGSDPWGAVFLGCYTFDPVDNVEEVLVRLHVPPQGELVTGFSAGAEGAVLEIAGQLQPGELAARAVAEIAGRSIELTMTYIGALPN
jgi:hypothetical protein